MIWASANWVCGGALDNLSGCQVLIEESLPKTTLCQDYCKAAESQDIVAE